VKLLFRPLGALVTCLIAATASAQNFYEARFLSGVTDFNRGAYARAVDELRVAAFGRVDDIAAYETAEIYLTLANDKLDHAEEARLSALKVVQSDRVSPVYAKLDLPAEVRSAFETLLPTLLTRDQLSHSSSFARIAGQAPAVQPGTPRLSTKPRPPVPTPSQKPNVAVTSKKNDDDVAPPENLDYGQMALDRVAAADETGGQRYAGLALALDETNVKAHTALAQIAYAHKAWRDVAEHYAVVRTRRRLTDDESAAYFIALTKISRNADALGVRRGLPPSVLARSDVREASEALDPKPAPQPAPQPLAPQPRATQPSSPQSSSPQPPAPRQPVPQPAPAPRQPEPQRPAPQPPEPQIPAPRQPVSQPSSQPVSPATRPAPSAPVPAPPAESADKPPISIQINAAERLLGQNDIVGARSELRRIAALPNLQRNERLALGRAMSQTALYAESSAQYRKTYPLKAGEEAHMFYESVNRYQIGDYDLARQLMTRALPSLPQTPAILAYRDRILGQQ
jgi:outer membrane biosynthesis protein TonB